MRNGIFPNPSSDIITINYSVLDGANVIIQLSDATGRVVKKEEIKNQSTGKQSQTMNISSLAHGVYICNIHVGDSIVSKRIIKQ